GELNGSIEAVDAATSALDTSPFGLNAHAAGDDKLAMFLDIGIRWYRVDCEWFHNEPREGEFDWYDTDRMVDTLKARGASIKIDASYTPPWASGGSLGAM